MYPRITFGLILISSLSSSLSQKSPPTTKICKTDNLKRIRTFSSLLEYQLTRDSFDVDERGYKGNIVAFNFETIENVAKNSFITYGSENIQKLILDHKGIKLLNVGSFRGLSCLQELNLAHNKIFNISEGVFDGLSNLRELDLSNNLLETVTDNGLAFYALKKLEILDLSKNQILFVPRISFVPLANLRLLNLSYNGLRRFDDDVFDGLESLEVLLLNGNRLATIKPEMWENVGNLSFLDLSVNHLPSFDTSYNFSFSNLKTLNLSNNFLTTLNVNAMKTYLPNLQVLDIDKNPWFCQDLADIRHALFGSHIILKEVSCKEENDTFILPVVTDKEQRAFTAEPKKYLINTDNRSKNTNIPAQYDELLNVTQKLNQSLTHMKSLMIFFFILVLMVLVVVTILKANYCRRLFFRSSEDTPYLDCATVENVRLIAR